MKKSEKKVAKAMQVNYFKKYHKKISLEEASERVYELLEWCRTEGKEFQRTHPAESDRIARKILEDRKKNPKLKN